MIDLALLFVGLQLVANGENIVRDLQNLRLRIKEVNFVPSMEADSN